MTLGYWKHTYCRVSADRCLSWCVQVSGAAGGLQGDGRGPAADAGLEGEADPGVQV